MKKKTLYLDMDGVVSDFRGGVMKYNPNAFDDQTLTHHDEVDKVCEANPHIFSELYPIQDSIFYVNKLFALYDIYFLSTPMWNVPQSFMCKRIWLDSFFGAKAEKRLILTHRKDFNIGELLVDDTTNNGAGEFKGTHIHFGTEKFPDWKTTYTFLESIASKPHIDISSKTFTAKEIRTKLRELAPHITNDTVTTPFMYQGIEKWYHELKSL